MKRKIVIAAAAVIFIFALLLTVYPLVSNFYNNRHAAEVYTEYLEQLKQEDNIKLQNEKKKAEEYNEAIRPGAQNTESFTEEALVNAAKDYWKLLNLAGDGVMGYIDIPDIKVNLPIYHGTAMDVLERGAGHLLGSSLPVGGESTHAVLTAHSGLASRKMFSDLGQLQLGDIYYLHVLGETLAYQIDQIKSVLPSEADFLTVENGKDFCTLITCSPLGVNTHRLLVRGTRIPYEEAKAKDDTTKDKPMSAWEKQYIGGICLGLTGTAAVGAAIVVYNKKIAKKGRKS